MKAYDILIVGAGPAGIFAGIALSRLGYDVLLAEKNRKPKRKICGEYLCPYGVQTMESQGFGGFLRSRFPLIKGLQIHSPGGWSVQSEFSRSESVYGYSVKRGDFESSLLEEAGNSRLDFRSGLRLTGLRRLKDGWECAFKSGETLRSRLLVGADGIFSATAKLLGIKKKIRSERIALHSILPNLMPDRNTARMYLFDKGKYAGLNPSGDELNVTLVCDKTLLGRDYLPDDLYRDLVEATQLPFLKAKPLERVRKLSPVSATVLRETDFRAVLIGDAAGYVDPLTGEGISTAVKSALMLASALGERVANRLENDEALQRALVGYVKNKRTYFNQKLALNRGFQTLIRFPRACDRLAAFIGSKQNRSFSFLSVLSNEIKPWKGMWQILTS